MMISKWKKTLILAFQGLTFSDQKANYIHLHSSFIDYYISCELDIFYWINKFNLRNDHMYF